MPFFWVFVRTVARTALSAKCDGLSTKLFTGGKENWMMAHPEGFR